MIYVICFYWQGDRWQENRKPVEDLNYEMHLRRVGRVDKQLASKYINNLYLGIRKWCGIPFKFVCFTNESVDVLKDVEIRKFPLVSKKGVMPRLFMFSEESGLFGHQVLCLDIDVIVTGSLKDIAGYEGLYCTRTSFRRGQTHLLDGDIQSFKASPGLEKIFWTPFIKDVSKAEELTQGRERYWVRHVASDIADTWDKVAPGQVVSYKRHIRNTGNISKNVRIVSCHGHPRPHQINEEWTKIHWK